MIWLTWCQHRTEAIVSGILLLLIGIVLLITGINIASTYKHLGLDTCTVPNEQCALAKAKFTTYISSEAFGNQTLYMVFLVTILALPALVGVFLGSAVVARELENGTHRLVWTQSITHHRWLSSKVAILFFTILCAFGLLYLVFLWWSRPIVTVAEMNWSFYDAWGIVPLAYGVFAFAIGVAAGTVVRRTVPAMAITLVLFIALRLLITLLWRPYFLPPIIVTGAFNNENLSYPDRAWVLSQNILDRQGNVLQYNTLPICDDQTGKQTWQEYEACMTNHGAQRRIIYQPVERLWLFQGIECGIYLVATLLLLGLTFW